MRNGIESYLRLKGVFAKVDCLYRRDAFKPLLSSKIKC